MRRAGAAYAHARAGFRVHRVWYIPPSIKDIGGTCEEHRRFIMHFFAMMTLSHLLKRLAADPHRTYWRLNAMSITPRARTLIAVEDAPLVLELSTTVGVATLLTVGTVTLLRVVTVD